MTILKLSDPSMPVEGKLLEILCCPVCKTPLKILSPARLDKLNQAIASGEVLYVTGEQVKAAIPEALTTTDDKVIYCVEDNIPILLEEKGIGTTQFQDW